MAGKFVKSSRSYTKPPVTVIFSFRGICSKLLLAKVFLIQKENFAATIAVIGGVRMPCDCEDAPIYYAFAEEF